MQGIRITVLYKMIKESSELKNTCSFAYRKWWEISLPKPNCTICELFAQISAKNCTRYPEIVDSTMLFSCKLLFHHNCWFGKSGLVSSWKDKDIVSAIYYRPRFFGNKELVTLRSIRRVWLFSRCFTLVWSRSKKFATRNLPAKYLRHTGFSSSSVFRIRIDEKNCPEAHDRFRGYCRFSCVRTRYYPVHGSLY